MAISSSLETFLLLLFSFIITIIFIHNKWISFHSKKKKKLTPPSPQKLPIIGNLHQLGSNPYRALQALSQKHGPLMLLHLGSLPTLVASSSEAAKEIFNTHDVSFSNRPHLTIPDILFYRSRDIAFSPYGEYWKHLKNIAVVHLLSDSHVKSYQKVRENEIGDMISMLTKSCGTTFHMETLFALYVNNIFCKVVLGSRFDEVKQASNLLRKFTATIGGFSVGSYIPWLSWVDHLSGSVGRVKKMAKEFDDFLEGVIEKHVNKRRLEGKKGDVAQDFVDILLDVQNDKTKGVTLHNDSLKAMIMDILFGTESTLASLEWAMSELVRNPRIMKKLQHEVTEIAQGRSMISEEDLEKMHYLKAVLKETFRLHTPVPLLVPRKSTQDVKLMGYDIAKDTQVIVNAWAIARDPVLWEEPMEFRPERFLNSSITYHGFHFELLPFGAGRRMCPGMQFSVIIMELALANIAYKFDFTLSNGKRNEDLDMSATYGVSLHRKSPLSVKVSPRF